MTELCKRHGIWGKRSEDKFVPDAIFGLDERDIARFLGILFACDGHIYATERLRQVGYSTISERLARDVQHLLLRLGIVSCIRTLKRAVYDGTGKVAREVRITGQDGSSASATSSTSAGKAPQAGRALAGAEGRHARDERRHAARRRSGSGCSRSRASVRGPRSATPPATREPQLARRTRGLSRPQLQKIADWSADEELDQLATSDLWWDEIVSIEPIGEEETFDLTVPVHHNFVADDLVVHNSALVTNIAENAAIDHGRPVALFSLEMSETELAQRFVASQGRIKGDELRKGRVPDSKWPKILQASAKLAAAPLYVDDSSDVGIIEIRAKARRLHQQQPLGLIIIDYLQLMRPDGRVESRVQQVGEMSRGLKILARELNVPVIALSQLSRAVETRGQSIESKRPLLSDLRESGSIEQDADLVAFIFREEYYDKESERAGIADIIIAKHRNGAIGDVELTFAKEYPKFLNYTSPDATREAPDPTRSAGRRPGGAARRARAGPPHDDGGDDEQRRGLEPRRAPSVLRVR